MKIILEKDTDLKALEAKINKPDLWTEEHRKG